MPESATSVFSPATSSATKTGGSTSEKPGISNESIADQSSSFSSKLSLAEDRQRSDLAKSDTPGQRTKSGGKPDANLDAENIRESAASVNAATQSRAGRSIVATETPGVNLTASDNRRADTASSESVSISGGNLDTVSDGEDRHNTSQKQDVLLVALPVSIRDRKTESVASEVVTDDINEEALSVNDNVEKKNVLESVQNRPIEADRDLGQDSGNESSKLAKPTSDELLVSSGERATSSEEATSTTIVAAAPPVAVPATGQKNSVSVETVDSVVSTDTSLAPEISKNIGLSGSLNDINASVARNISSENTASVSDIGIRMGRLSSPVDPLSTDKPIATPLAGDTKPNVMLDAGTLNLRNQNVGRGAEKALNSVLQSSGSELSAMNDEQSQGILISDLTLPKVTSALVKDTQTTLPATVGRASVSLVENLQAPVVLEPEQAGSQLNVSGVRNELPVTDLPKGLTGSTAFDPMLTTPPSGIVTAPVLARVDLANPQNSNMPVLAPLNVPLLASGASEGLSGNIRWMVGEGIQNATVSVTPSGMGPITVQIGVEKDQMNISIVAAQASTREALEATLPRLREQLGTQGLESVRVDVSDGRSDQSKSNTGNERYLMGGNTGSAQGQNTETSNNENASAGFGHNNQHDSGERALSDTERNLLSRLKELSTDPFVAQSTIRHGYDLYV